MDKRLDSKEDNEVKKIEFPDYGVTFKLPRSLEHLHVKDLGPPNIWPVDPNTDPAGNFAKPDGFAMQFEILDPATGAKPVLNDDISVKVKFKDKHLVSAGGYSKLQLGIHNSSGWHNVTSKSDKKEYKVNYKSKWRGCFKLKIRGEADPVITWGP